MSRFSKLQRASALSVCVLLGACSDVYFDRRDTIALSAGDAIASNSVAQMVDPWPRSSANKNIAFNGERMQSAVERYRKNQVIQPVSATTNTSYAQSQQAAAPVAPPPAAAPPPPPPPTPPSFASSTPTTIPVASSSASAPPSASTPTR